MQDVFVLLLRHGPRLSDRHPSSLLFRMATNVCINMIRSKWRSVEFVPGEVIDAFGAYSSMEDQIAARDLLDVIFSEEKESTRLMAVMYYMDGMTLEEVACETGFSVSGVRKRLRELRKNAISLKESQL
jgi:RNA polymerase sigma-70 factor (ECF subfamily)